MPNSNSYEYGLINMWNIVNQCVQKHGVAVIDGVNDAKFNTGTQLLEWLKSLSVIDSDVNGANTAARLGKLSILKWLHRYKDIRPNHIGMDFAIQNKHSHVLIWGTEYDIYPDDYAIDNLIIRKIDKKSLKCLEVLAKKGKYADQRIINKLAVDGKIKNLKKIYRATNQLPTEFVFEECVTNNLPKVIKFLISHNIHPSDVDKLNDIAISNKYTKITKLFNKSPYLLSP